MEWTARRFHVAALAQKGQELQFGSVEIARDVDGLTANDDDFLAKQKLFGNHGSQTTEQMVLSINDNGSSLESHFVFLLQNLNL